MPALKFSKAFYWLIHKQDNDVTIGIRYDNDQWMEMLGSEDDHPMSWINTHFHVFPLEVPLDILEFNSPQANSNVPKG